MRKKEYIIAHNYLMLLEEYLKKVDSQETSLYIRRLKEVLKNHKVKRLAKERAEKSYPKRSAGRVVTLDKHGNFRYSGKNWHKNK